MHEQIHIYLGVLSLGLEEVTVVFPEYGRPPEAAPSLGGKQSSEDGGALPGAGVTLLALTRQWHRDYHRDNLIQHPAIVPLQPLNESIQWQLILP